jgi:hypothetical protein
MAAIDDYDTNRPGLNSPADYIEDVTPHDVNELTRVSRMLRVSGAAGDIAIKTRAGATKIIKAAQLYEQIAVRAKQVLATGTTATGIQSFA